MLTGLAGLGVLAWAVALAAFQLQAVWRSSKAAGQIVKMIDTGNDVSTPLVGFVDASGAHHTFMPGHAASAVRYRPGDGVVVLYDAADPARARVADYQRAFADALLVGSAGALLLLIAGAIARRAAGSAREGQAGAAARRDPSSGAVSSAPATRGRGRGEPGLQFHPFNAVAVKHYLGGLAKPASARKVKITESRLALAQGRVPVALAEFLAYASALAYHEDGARFLATCCPSAGEPHLVTHNGSRALCFLFEDAAVIAVADPDSASAGAALGGLFNPNAGARQYVPEDAVWDAAPRARGAARAWVGLRMGVEAWLKGVSQQDAGEDKPAIMLAGHHRGGAIAVLAAYEFAKRGRNPACIMTFGAPAAGGRAFAADYAELGLEERSLHVVAPDAGLHAWPVRARTPGLIFGLEAAKVPEEYGAAPGSAGRIWLRLGSTGRECRRALLRYDIERRYALGLTDLIHGRLLELFLADSGADPVREAYAALSDHLRDIRGVRPQDAGKGFATLTGLPAMPAMAPTAAVPGSKDLPATSG